MKFAGCILPRPPPHPPTPSPMLLAESLFGVGSYIKAREGAFVYLKDLLCKCSKWSVHLSCNNVGSCCQM